MALNAGATYQVAFSLTSTTSAENPGSLVLRLKENGRSVTVEAPITIIQLDEP